SPTCPLATSAAVLTPRSRSEHWGEYHAESGAAAIGWHIGERDEYSRANPSPTVNGGNNAMASGATHAAPGSIAMV
ncbi:MAG: hypothetical protein M3Y58_09065, partial [Chloroflexota bacterium]|nr:hypothetical protein [Chloroflexota bacterium]